MAGEVVLIDPQTGLSYKAGGTSGPQPAAASQSVTPASDSGPFPVAGPMANNSLATGNPVLIAGSDGSNLRTVMTNSVGALRLGISSGASTVTGNTLAADALATTLVGVDTRAFQHLYNGTTFDRARGESGSAYCITTPGGSATVALARQFTTTAASSLVVKASAGNLFGYNIVSGAVAGYVMFFDATTAPADGTVTPKMCFALAANASIQADRDIPVRFTTGITMVFSSTGPFTKTASATAFLAGDAV